MGGGVGKIADIARHRRKSKVLPLINTDSTDPDKGRLEFNPGVESCKSIFFGVELGEGGGRACARRSPESPTSAATQHSSF